VESFLRGRESAGLYARAVASPGRGWKIRWGPPRGGGSRRPVCGDFPEYPHPRGDVEGFSSEKGFPLLMSCCGVWRRLPEAGESASGPATRSEAWAVASLPWRQGAAPVGGYGGRQVDVGAGKAVTRNTEG
jgi:hypothetical protein